MAKAGDYEQLETWLSGDEDFRGGDPDELEAPDAEAEQKSLTFADKLDILLSTNDNGQNILHLAIENKRTGFVDKVRSSASHVLTTREGSRMYVPQNARASRSSHSSSQPQPTRCAPLMYLWSIPRAALCLPATRGRCDHEQASPLRPRLEERRWSSLRRGPAGGPRENAMGAAHVAGQGWSERGRAQSNRGPHAHSGPPP